MHIAAHTKIPRFFMMRNQHCVDRIVRALSNSLCIYIVEVGFKKYPSHIAKRWAYVYFSKNPVSRNCNSSAFSRIPLRR